MDQPEQTDTFDDSNVRQVGDLIVVLLPFRILDEAVIAECSHRLQPLLIPGTKLVVDFRNTLHLSSAALGMLLNLNNRARESRARLVFCNIRPAMYEGFAVTRMNRLFKILGSLEEAVFFYTDAWITSCPVFGCTGSAPASRSTLSGLPGHVCDQCATHFVLERAELRSESNKVVVSEMRLPTYSGEHVRVVAAKPYIIEVIGRLDLFASTAFGQAFASLPAPRRAVVDFTNSTEVTEAGLRSLLPHLRAVDAGRSDDRAVLLVRPGSQSPEGLLPSGMIVYPSIDTAAAALGDIPEASRAPILTTVRPAV